MGLETCKIDARFAVVDLLGHSRTDSLTIIPLVLPTWMLHRTAGDGCAHERTDTS